MKPYSRRRARVRRALRRDRRRAPGAHGLGRRGRRRLRARSAVRRRSASRASPSSARGSGSGTEAPWLRARPRRSVALRGGVRGDRLVAVHRARDRRGDRARVHAARPPRRRRGVRPRLALVRGGHRRPAGDRRSGDLRAACVQRPRRIRDGLGALPRLPHRHGALGALRAPLPRRRGRPVDRFASRRGMQSSAAGSSPRSQECGSLGGRVSTSVRSPSRCSTCSCRASSSCSGSRSCSRRRRSARGSASRAARTGATSRSRCLSRCSRTRVSRRSRTSQRRRPSRVARSRDRSSPRSGSSSW